MQLSRRFKNIVPNHSPVMSNARWNLLRSCLATGLTFGLGGCWMGLSSSHPKVHLSEVRQTVGAMNRAQQAYFLEKNRFTDSLAALELGIQPRTRYYQYSTQVNSKAAFNYGIAHGDRVTRYFGPIPYQVKGKFYGFVGGVFVVPSEAKGQKTTVAILCQTIAPNTHDRPLPPVLEQGKPICATGTKDLGL